MNVSHVVATKEFHRAGAWNALRDARALYSEGRSKGVAAAMKRFRAQRQLSKIMPTKNTLSEMRVQQELEWWQREIERNPFARLKTILIQDE